MQTRAVESCCHGEADVVLQCLIGWRRVDAVRVKALIKNETLENGNAVDQETIAVKFYLTQAKIALYFIITEGQFQVVQISLARLPQVSL